MSWRLLSDASGRWCGVAEVGVTVVVRVVVEMAWTMVVSSSASGWKTSQLGKRQKPEGASVGWLGGVPFSGT